MSKKELQMPTVLSFEKKLVASDGYFYGTTWGERSNKQNIQPLSLNEKLVRGTISHYLSDAEEDSVLKSSADVENANIQTIDACALGEHQDTLKLDFTLKILGGVDKPSACNNDTFYQAYQEVAKGYIEQFGFAELAKRYALNIANARFLWRNRVGAEKVEVVVTKEGGTDDKKPWVFNSLKYPLSGFDSVDTDIQSLANEIAQALSGKIPYLMLSISAYALVGRGQEVYPSEELALDKDKGPGKKSKILYRIKDVAGMHSQKIGNALRTIDTWYPEFDEKRMAIAIEPYGQVTNLGAAYRKRSTKVDFFTLLNKYSLGLGDSLRDEDQHYVMATLVRGGVFGVSIKKESGTKKIKQSKDV